jgi:hypothetical protein
MVEDKNTSISSRKVQSDHATAVGGVVVVVVDGGGCISPSSFRFFPLGAGSSGGDLL